MTVEKFARGPVWAAAAAQGALLMVSSFGYDYQRDELYYRMLQPAWGYVDQPPLTPAIARMTLHLADAENATGVRNGFVLMLIVLLGPPLVVVWGTGIVWLLRSPRRNVDGWLVVGRATVVDAGPMAANQIGWSQYVAQIARIYDDLPAPRPPILTSNYGQAGALDRYGPEFGLPATYSAQNALYDERRLPEDTDAVLLIGDSDAGLQHCSNRARFWRSSTTDSESTTTSKASPLRCAKIRMIRSICGRHFGTWIDAAPPHTPDLADQ